VLDDPDGVDPDPVGELALLDRLEQHSLLVAVLPRARHLVLEEQADLHVARSMSGRR
jgi:hypothetical protein